MLSDTDITFDDEAPTYWGEEMQQRIVALTEELFPRPGMASTANATACTVSLEAAVDLLKQSGLILNAIWFVDHHERYHIFMSMCGLAGTADSIMSAGPDIHNWESRFFDKENEMIANRRDDLGAMLQKSRLEKLIWPWVCGHPGIWAQFSDGSFWRLDINETPWRELADGIRSQREACNGR
jgi:hypothetical protein